MPNNGYLQDNNGPHRQEVGSNFLAFAGRVSYLEYVLSESGRSSARLERGAYGAKVAGSRMIVCILRSRKTRRYYTGVTEDLDVRFGQHYEGRNSSTRSGVPWEIVYTKKCDTRSQALQQEKQIKSRGAGRFLESFNRSISDVIGA